MDTMDSADHHIIPTPCHQSWDGLEKHTDTIRHCAECDCNVHDLTGMSHTQIYQLRDQLGGKLCGRIYKKDNTSTTHTLSPDPEIEMPESRHRSPFTFPVIISGSIAALSIASCSPASLPEEKSETISRQPFPKDKIKKEQQIPDCVLGVIASPPPRPSTER